MKYGFLFSLLSILLAILAVQHGGWYLLMLWPAVSLGIISLAYFHFGPGVYRKSTGGIQSPFNVILLFPFLLSLWTAWYLLRITKREPAYDWLTNKIVIGRRLLSSEFPEDIDHVIDLTCEFTEPKALRSASYHLFAVLDGFVPTITQLREWVALATKLSGTIYIHCAEGHGRTGLFAAALLLHLGECQTPDDALARIQSKRPKVRLGNRQREALEAFFESSRSP